MPTDKIPVVHLHLNFIYDLRLRNDLYCVEWGVKLYSLTLWTIYPNLAGFKVGGATIELSL